MDKEHVKGAADKVAGKIKEVAGHVTGNKKLETEGKLDQLKGAAHRAKDAGKQAIESVKNAPSRHRGNAMLDTSLRTHELLCLHLKCFYGVQPGSPSPKSPTGGAISTKVSKKSRLFRRERIRI